jgi:uncharacterized protein YciI
VKYFAAFLRMQDPAKNQELRPQHLEFLQRSEKAGTIFARGRFADDSGGLVIYKAETLDAAKEIAGRDPYILSGARRLELHEWDAKFPQ